MAYTTINKPTDYFNTKLYTGTGAIQSITGVGHEPDMIWCKERGASNGGPITDKVRGISTTSSPFLISQSGDAQQGDNGTVSRRTITATGADGFTLGADGYYTNFNKNNGSFVSWNWKANGQGSSNTAGSINTAYTSANTTAGFSISKWTGTGSNATVGHGLGVAPKMVINKRIDGGTNNWVVGHAGIGFTENIYLNETNAKATDGGSWNNTAPTNSVFSVGTNNESNGSGSEFISYCFAEKTGYSKFGSYTGNGNANGTFVYIGFKPAWVMIKRTNSADAWYMYDNKRQGFNPSNELLRANVSNAESTPDRIDLLSNGFKLTDTDGSVNGSGGNYIYMAFAEAPLVGTNGVTAKAR